METPGDGRVAPDPFGPPTGLLSSSRSGIVRFLAEGAAAGFALLTGVITARSLGPPGKGALSTLSYLVALAWPVAAVGSGEAGVALLGRGERTSTVVGSTLSLVMLTSLVAAPILVAVSALGSLGLTDLEAGRYAAGFAVPFTTVAMVLPLLAEYHHRFGTTALARVTIAAATFVATTVLAVSGHLTVGSATLAMALGPVAGCAVLVAGFRRAGLPLRPGWDGAYLRRALRLGLPAQLGLVMVVGAARADVLVIAAVGDVTQVGVYGVALTVAQFVTLAPIALAVPWVAKVAAASPSEATRMAAQAVRTTAVITVASAIALAVITPFVVPRVFGIGFQASVTPVFVLLPGAAANAFQWVGARLSGARGRTGAFPRTFGVSLAVMLALDPFLVRRWGTTGAATASTIAGLAGAVVAMAELRSWGVRLGGPAVADHPPSDL